MIVKTYALSDSCKREVRTILAGLKPRAGYDFDTAIERFMWKAGNALVSTKTVEADKAVKVPTASERKRLLDRYQKSLEMIAGMVDKGRDAELLKTDPYRTIWAEIESAMHQANLAKIPDLPSFQNVAANIAYAVSKIKREGHPGRFKGLSGREQAIEKALQAWHECFDEDVTTAETSPVVRALHAIEADIRAADPGIGATRQAVRNVVGKRGQRRSELPLAQPTDEHDLAKRNRKLREAFALLHGQDRDVRFRMALADLDIRRKAGLIDDTALGRMEEWERSILEALKCGPRPLGHDLRTIL